jgi:hypothetical protein
MMVSQGGFGASTSGIGVKDIYATLFGVTGNKVDPEKATVPELANNADSAQGIHPDNFVSV